MGEVLLSSMLYKEDPSSPAFEHTRKQQVWKLSSAAVFVPQINTQFGRLTTERPKLRRLTKNEADARRRAKVNDFL
jgi:hypothetical protein